MTTVRETPGIARRLLCLVYEVLLLTAVILLAGGVATGLAQIPGLPDVRLLARFVVPLACAAYFALQWLRTGQTLPLKTWHIRLETVTGAPLTLPVALKRMLLATIGYLACGVTILWSFIDRDSQFLHDRLAGTRLVVTQKTG